MANGQPTPIRGTAATRNHLRALISDAQPSIDSLALSLEMLANAKAVPAEHHHIAMYICDALADLKDRIEGHFTPAEVDHAA